MASSSVEEIGSKRRLRGRLCVLEFVHDPSDGRSGGVLEVAGDGQGGRHRGRVGPGGVAGVVEEGAGSQFVLAHAQRTDRVCRSS